MPVYRFLLAVEEGYASNPYHCSTHAADVLRTLHAVLTQGGVLTALTAAAAVSGQEVGFICRPPCLQPRSLTPAMLRQCPPGSSQAADSFTAATLLTSYLSAIVHDFDHRGVNNDFLIRTADPLALLYNDTSPQVGR